MTLLNGTTPRGATSIAADATLETAARLLTQVNESEAVVVDDMRMPLGRVSLQQIARAMVTPKTAKDGEDAVRSLSEATLVS